MTRKPMPDIISNLLQSKPDSKPVEQYTSTPVSQYAGIPVKRHTSKPVKKHTSKPAEKQAKPIKATFYLSPGAIEALEQLWMNRRQEAAPQQRGRISKSHLVEEAIFRLGQG